MSLVTSIFANSNLFSTSSQALSTLTPVLDRITTKNLEKGKASIRSFTLPGFTSLPHNYTKYNYFDRENSLLHKSLLFSLLSLFDEFLSTV